MPLPTSSLKFSGPSSLQPRNAADPVTGDGMSTAFSGASKLTVAFWLKVDTFPAISVSPLVLWVYGGVLCRLDSSGLQFITATTGTGGFQEIGTSRVPIQLGSWTLHVASLDASTSGADTLNVYKDSRLARTATGPNGPRTVAFNGGRAQLVLGNFSDYYAAWDNTCVMSMADVAVWKDYAATAQDVSDLLYAVKRPTDIAPSSLLIHFTGSGGTAGATVADTDAGVTNGGDAGFSYVAGFQYRLQSLYSLGTGDSVRPGGTFTYGGAPSYSPPVLATPYLSTSGKLLYFIFRTRVSNTLSRIPYTVTRATVADHDPSISIARQGGGTDTATLTTSYFDNASDTHLDGGRGAPYLAYDLVADGLTAVGSGDVATVTCARDWTQTVDGSVDAVSTTAPMASPLPAIP